MSTNNKELFIEKIYDDLDYNVQEQVNFCLEFKEILDLYFPNDLLDSIFVGFLIMPYDNKEVEIIKTAINNALFDTSDIFADKSFYENLLDYSIELIIIVSRLLKLVTYMRAYPTWESLMETREKILTNLNSLNETEPNYL